MNSATGGLRSLPFQGPKSLIFDQFPGPPLPMALVEKDMTRRRQCKLASSKKIYLCKGPLRQVLIGLRLRTPYRVRTINQDSFSVKLLSKQLVIEMFVGTHWKAVCLWYKLMLKNCFYSQRQVGKGRNLCSCAKSSARKKKTSQSKPHNFPI